MDGINPQGPSPLPPNAPQGAPMAIPQPKEGMQAKARVLIQQASKLLDEALHQFPADSKEFKDIYSAYKSLSKAFGNEASKEVSNAGLKQIASALGPKGLTPPGGPGGAPGGAPSAGGGTNPLGPVASILGGMMGK